MRIATLIFFVAFLAFEPAFAQTGRISGRVTEAGTGEPLPGVNVVIDGTQSGATTGLDGNYNILNVPPGTVRLNFSFIGFARHVAEDVRVSIDQTTTVNAVLREEVFSGEEVIVRAERPVVQPDVSNSRVNVSAAEIEALPAANIGAVVGLQAGIQDGLVVRGNSSTQLSFMVNGLTLRDERSNRPHTNISLCSVEEVQVQTGGFNAEFGNVRSGVVNVVTKEGSPDRYEGCVFLRYRPAAPKHFGPSANDPNSYWIRPYTDPDVAFTGTSSWDFATQQQYPAWHGWIAESQEWIADPNKPDMTPEALYQAFLWQHRKSMAITAPDYDVDVGFGGPIARQLGNLRFFASYRRSEEMYMIPLNTDRYDEQTGHMKLTSDVGRGMRLSVEGRISEESGTASDRGGQPGVFRSAGGIAEHLTGAGGAGGVGFIDSRIFSTDYFTPTNVRTNQIGATFTHMLNPASFYEVRFNRFHSRYDTNPGRARDTTAVAFFGGVGFDEGPFGYFPFPSDGVGSGLRMGVGMSNARDTSQVSVYSLKADFTSQVNRIMLVQTGVEYNLTDSRVNYGRFDEYLPSANEHRFWNRTPNRAAAYGQTRLEFLGMITNLGLRADYFHAGSWYDFDRFDAAFRQRPNPLQGLDTLVAQISTDRQLVLSPRLGVSFPMTTTSKLFFNYGHFRSMPDPNHLYLISYLSSTGRINRVANPNSPLPKTVAYEGGFEQSILGQFLIRAAGYYRDVSLEPRLVDYRNRSGDVVYSRTEPHTFNDIRGFELTLSRDRGDWIRGFVNYTYMVYKAGYFGTRLVDENPRRQRDDEEAELAGRTVQSRPVPQPYGRINIDLFSPRDFGPEIAGFRPLGEWRASILGRWQSGGRMTWVGGGARPDVINNLSREDFWNVDLRFARTFNVQKRQLTFFADVFNVTNRRHFSGLGFVDGPNRTAYLESLHLPESPHYGNIPGSDRYGAFRDYNVAFQPMRGIQSREQTQNPNPGIIYYEFSTAGWLVFRDGVWQQADPSRVQEVLDTNAYISMPNQSFMAFLNPRNVILGIRLNL
ncbi:hypothetical protein BH23ACT11_BH23ACT11_04300 [soil metagenome]